MRLTKSINLLLVLASLLGVAVWLVSARSSQATSAPIPEDKPAKRLPAKTDAGYVGTDVCKDCHEDQFKAYSHTTHADLAKVSSWKDKVTGCETCHGPGQAHVEAGGDKTKIISFVGKSSKEISETCLDCHAGKEERNNFRRGEHWRNDIGCSDCHTAHSLITGRNLASSNRFLTTDNAEKPGFAMAKMLKATDPVLCIACHEEVKPAFNMPFRHKVLEGAMRCSDCHNPHGGFELKQTRVATGADAACIKCHADKQGPFTFEHAPIKQEGCQACHTPHGSANPRLLQYSAVNQLCLTCHSVDHGVGAAEPVGPAHNQNQQYRDCTACHVKIHGSRSSPVFFR